MLHRKTLALAGYITFGVLALLLSFYATFPSDALAARLAHEVQRQSAGAWLLSYGDTGMYHLSGIALEQVTLTHAVSDGAPTILQFDAVRARLRLLPLLIARLSVDATIDQGDGTVKVRISPQGKGAVEVSAAADTFDLQKVPALAALAGLPILGKLSGSLQGSWDGDVRRAGAVVDVDLAAAGVGPGTVAGFTLPTVDLGELILGVELKEGKLRVTQFKQKGGSLNLQLRGNMLLRQPLAASNLDACLQFRAEPAFLADNPKIKVALQLAEVQLKKDSEGFFHLPVSGAVTAPRTGQGLCR